MNIKNDPLKSFPGNFVKDFSCVEELGVKIYLHREFTLVQNFSF